ncbi:MAG: hypothetical protein ACE14P_14115 [Methanotrichaceae archaeon]
MLIDLSIEAISVAAPPLTRDRSSTFLVSLLMSSGFFEMLETEAATVCRSVAEFLPCFDVSLR